MNPGITTTISIPRDLWLALRRAQEEKKITSIRQAAVKGLRLVLAMMPEKEAEE